MHERGSISKLIGRCGPCGLWPTIQLGETMETSESHGSVRIEVVDQDLLWAERFTRQLHRDFAESEAFTVSYVEEDAAVRDGVKGAVASSVLAVVAVWGWPVGAPLLAELLKSRWHREERGKVRVTVGADFVEVAGEPTKAQQELLLALLTEKPKQ